MYLNVQPHLQSGLFYVKITHFVDQKCLGCCLSPCLEVKGKEAFVWNLSALSEDEVRNGLHKYITALFNTDGGYT